MKFVEYEVQEKYALKNALESDDHNSFSDAGYLLESNDYIVDIDDIPKDLIKTIISYFNIGTQIVWTERGAHLYFKKPKDFRRGANSISPLGFPYEIKHTGNTKSVTIKRNGILREIENKGVREEAPFIFTYSRRFDKLYGLGDGDGRNNALWTLRSQIASEPDWKKIIHFVNNHIFADPLDPEEVDTITREVHVEAVENNEYEVAGWLMNEFKVVRYSDSLYFKIGDDYTDDKSILLKEIFNKVGNQKTRYVDEVFKQMEYRSKIVHSETIFPISFKNGYLHNGEFVPVILDEFTPYVMKIDYLEDAKPVKEVDDYLDHLTGGDKDYIHLLKQVLGYTMIVDPEFKRMLAKFFIFVGDGGNGKGTLLQIIKTILGTDNVTGMGIKELSNERYLPSLKGKLANLGDDIQDASINDKDMKILKNISTCDYISTRELYEGAKDTFFTATLIFTSNHILRSWEKGESYKRRVTWLPMYGKVKKKDPLFISKLTTEEALEYWIRLMVEGYMSLYETHAFIEPEKIKKFNEEYHQRNNPILDYIKGKSVEDFVDNPIADVYEDYKMWHEDNFDTDIDKPNTIELKKTLETELRLEEKPVWNPVLKKTQRQFVPMD